MNRFGKMLFAALCCLTALYVDVDIVMATESNLAICTINRKDNIRDVTFVARRKEKSLIAKLAGSHNQNLIDDWVDSGIRLALEGQAQRMKAPFQHIDIPSTFLDWGTDYDYLSSLPFTTEYVLIFDGGGYRNDFAQNGTISTSPIHLQGTLFRVGNNQVVWQMSVGGSTDSSTEGDHKALISSLVNDIVTSLYGWKGLLADPSGMVALDAQTARSFVPNTPGKGYLYLIAPQKDFESCSVGINNNWLNFMPEQYAAIELPEGVYSFLVRPDNIKQTVTIKSGQLTFVEIRPRRLPSFISSPTAVKVLDAVEGKKAIAKAENKFYPEELTENLPEATGTTFKIMQKPYRLTRVRTLIGHSGDVNAVAFSPDKSILASGGKDNFVILWDTKTWKELKRFSSHEENVTAVAFSPDGKMLASGDKNKRVLVWDVATGRNTTTLKVGGEVNVVAFSPDGRTIATVGESSVVLLWDAASGKEVKELKGHSGDVRTIAFSHDGKFIASGGEDDNVIIWDAATLKEIRRFKGHSEAVTSVVFSQDGRFLASGDNGKLIYVWNVATGDNINILGGHGDEIRSLAVIKGSGVLVSADSKCRVRYWDFATGNELGRGPNYCSIANIAISNDDTLIAMARKQITIMQISAASDGI